ASALDKPIINIAFDFDKKSYFNSVKRYYDQIHYKDIIKSNSTSLAKNPSEMITLLSKYLETPTIKKEERKRMNHILLAGNKGNASKNIANTVNTVLNKN
ncbi:hypothetical protein N9364_02855, partial [Alphaproteobacteria bacterium]|nr:hypothetical protein [Alphaproteobacteria bacterium]